MERSLFRAFIFSLIVVIALNFLFYIIGYSILGTLDIQFTRASSHPTYIVLWLTYPYTWFPWELIIDAMTRDPSIHIGLIIMDIGLVASLAVGSIVAAIFGGDFSKSLGGWVLTSLTCVAALFIIVIIDSFNLSWICWPCELGEAMVYILVVGVVNLLIFSGITLLTVLIVGSYGK